MEVLILLESSLDFKINVSVFAFASILINFYVILSRKLLSYLVKFSECFTEFYKLLNIDQMTYFHGGIRNKVLV
jgi:hypothetical protein